MHNKISMNSFHGKHAITVNESVYQIYSLQHASQHGLGDISKLPFSLRILLENLLRNEDGTTVTQQDIHALVAWQREKKSNHEICFYPGRVLMQDFTGVPAIVDLAAMRDVMVTLGQDPNKINPLTPVDLVIDHSVQVDAFGQTNSAQRNVDLEFQRNNERYRFLRWGQSGFNNFRVVPPGTGICHQVNLEYLAQVVWQHTVGNERFAYPDTVVGTDSHTTMINGLSVLGWGVGGIEAEAVMLNQPYSMLIPEVVGFKLDGELCEGITATDLVLTITEMLRKHKVVGKFVEFYGEGLQHLSLPDRATIANMAPEYGATCGFFPIDDETIRYLKLSGRDDTCIALVTAYAQHQGLWHYADGRHIEKEYSSNLSLNLSDVEASLAGPKRPQDRVSLSELPEKFLQSLAASNRTMDEHPSTTAIPDGHMQHGDVVIAAITSCTNTSNPSVMLAAGLVAKKAVALGLQVKPWVKTSLAPGSKVVTEYLQASGLQPYLDQLGFNLVGYGCTTCIGNSGPLEHSIEERIKEKNLMVSAVLSGNRNFEGRVHPLVEANWLASPPLVVAYALAGHTRLNLRSEPLCQDQQGRPIYLKDIWPTTAEINQALQCISRDMFIKDYADVFSGSQSWQSLERLESHTYTWDQTSTYIQHPPYFINFQKTPSIPQDIRQARILALLGDSVTTDHISPAGSIKVQSPAGRFLSEHQVDVADFNSYGARRGNHEVMLRGTFANIRIRNEMVPNTEGGVTRNLLTGETQAIFDAAMYYQAQQIPLVVIAGKEYGTGSSRDWAAKGTLLLGIKAVLAESFERIHRGNLIGMGVLPLEFPEGVNRHSLQLTGDEIIDVIGLEQAMLPKASIQVNFHKPDGSMYSIQALSRIDTQREADYYRHGGILPYVVRKLL